MTKPTETPALPDPPDEIRPGQFCAALGVPRSTLMNAMARGDADIPQPLGRTFGGQRRWTRAQLPEIVALLRARGRPVPDGWDVGAKAGRKGKRR